MNQHAALKILIGLVEKSCERSIQGRRVILTYEAAKDWLYLINNCRGLVETGGELAHVYFSPTYGWCIESEETGNELGSGFKSEQSAEEYATNSGYKLV